ncbi:hypothetical protein ACWEIJ_39415 [Lentzea sp. NPDC004789]
MPIRDEDRRAALTSLWSRTPGFKHSRCSERILTGDSPGEIEQAASEVRSADCGVLLVPTRSSEDVAARLGRHGLVVRPPKVLLRRDLAGHPAPPVPAGFELQVLQDDAIEVCVTHHGVIAARGFVTVEGQDAALHYFGTSRNREGLGLATVVIGALVGEALAAGATTGALAASEDGAHVCAKLGWHELADVVVAINDERHRDQRHFLDLGEVLRRWQRCWTTAWQLPRSPEGHSALRAHLDDVLHLFVTNDGATRFHLSQISLHEHQPSRLTIPTRRAEKAIAHAHERGLRVLPREKLLSRPLAGHPTPPVPEDCALTVTRTHLIEARITRAGQEIARGRAAVFHQDAAFLDVSGEPADVLMGVLAREALADGATTGLLISATALSGWRDEADIVTALNH